MKTNGYYQQKHTVFITFSLLSFSLCSTDLPNYIFIYNESTDAHSTFMELYRVHLKSSNSLKMCSHLLIYIKFHYASNIITRKVSTYKTLYFFKKILYDQCKEQLNPWPPAQWWPEVFENLPT